MSHCCIFYDTEIQCGDPGTPADGVKVGSDYKFGKSVSFECNPGFALRGSLRRTCKSDGAWDGTQPTCKGKFHSNYCSYN